MRAAAARAGIAVEVDSAGTGDWHVGEPPDQRALATADRHGVDIGGQRARQVTAEDFLTFDHIVALDRSNLAALARLRPLAAKAELSMLLDHAEGRRGQDVADPYFGAHEGFETAWRDIAAGVEGLLRRLGA